MAGPFAALRDLAEHAAIAVNEAFGGLARAACWMVFGSLLMICMQYGVDLWTDAAPVRDVHLTLTVDPWPDGRWALDIAYQPVHSRRCASLTTHFIQRSEDGTVGRIPVMTYSSGVAPVDADGLVRAVPFHLVIPLPIGLPPGEYWHQSSRTTSCDVIPGLQRHPAPSWTTAMPFVVPGG